MESRIKRTIRKIISAGTTTLVKHYIQKDRNYSYKGLHLKVFKGVFHPGLFRSTTVFAEWIALQNLTNKNVLEIGCGSGLISIVAAKQGAIVTAVDINNKAVENTILNASKNGVNINAYYSDLFDTIADQQFDLILINPPYYPKVPRNDYEHAWYCGETFDYFRKLFRQLKEKNPGEHCYMILSDTCDLSSINDIANKNLIALNEIFSRNIAGERLIIYKTASIDPA